MIKFKTRFINDVISSLNRILKVIYNTKKNIFIKCYHSTVTKYMTRQEINLNFLYWTVKDFLLTDLIKKL